MGRKEGLLAGFTPVERSRLWGAARRYDAGTLNDKADPGPKLGFLKWLVDHGKRTDFPYEHPTHAELQKAPSVPLQPLAERHRSPIQTSQVVFG